MIGETFPNEDFRDKVLREYQMTDLIPVRSRYRNSP